MADVSARFRERIATFGGRDALVGVLSLPVEPRPQVPHVILLNSGIVHRVGPHRNYVMFARSLASDGIPVLRFDLSGIGDSERQASAVTLQEAVRRDIAAAVDFLASEHGAVKFVLAGLCSGAFDAFEYALLDPRVAGGCMIDMPGPFRNWSHFAYRALVGVFRPMRLARVARLLNVQNGGARPPAPVDRPPLNFLPGVRGQKPRDQFEAELSALLDRGVRLAFLFTGGVSDHYNHRLQFRLRFPRTAAHPSLTTEFIPWSDHTFTTRASREYVTGFLQNWILRQAW